jgi:hypothetical protein
MDQNAAESLVEYELVEVGLGFAGLRPGGLYNSIAKIRFNAPRHRSESELVCHFGSGRWIRRKQSSGAILVCLSVSALGDSEP